MPDVPDADNRSLARLVADLMYADAVIPRDDLVDDAILGPVVAARRERYLELRHPMGFERASRISNEEAIQRLIDLAAQPGVPDTASGAKTTSS